MAAIVKPLKVKEVPELAICDPTALMVMVPLDGLKVAVDELVNAPSILNEEEVVTVAPVSTVKPLKTRLVVDPPLFTIEPPFFMVIVPPAGASVFPELTVKAPATA